MLQTISEHINRSLTLDNNITVCDLSISSTDLTGSGSTGFPLPSTLDERAVVSEVCQTPLRRFRVESASERKSSPLFGLHRERKAGRSKQYSESNIDSTAGVTVRPKKALRLRRCSSMTLIELSSLNLNGIASHNGGFESLTRSRARRPASASIMPDTGMSSSSSAHADLSSMTLPVDNDDSPLQNQSPLEDEVIELTLSPTASTSSVLPTELEVDIEEDATPVYSSNRRSE